MKKTVGSEQWAVSSKRASRLRRSTSAERLCLSVAGPLDSRGSASRPWRSLSRNSKAKTNGEAKPFRTSGGKAAKDASVSVSPCLRVVAAFCLLLTTHCPLFTAQAQPGMPQASSPLYGARQSSGTVATGLPKALQDVGLDQKLNNQLPLDLVFRDESGQQVKLGQYFGKRPVVLALVYYDCPMLCTQVLNGMTEAFRVLSFKQGEQYEVVSVSFDPRETPALAAAKKKKYVDYLPEEKRVAAMNGWHFLTGDDLNIKRITEAVGFRYHWDETTNQFAHASGIMVLTPQGKLAQYYYGIEYSAKDLRLGLVEASANKIGTPMDQLLLYCYHYDPATGKYGAVVMNMIRLGGIVTVVAIVGLLLVLRRRGGARTRLRAGGIA